MNLYPSRKIAFSQKIGIGLLLALFLSKNVSAENATPTATPIPSSSATVATVTEKPVEKPVEKIDDKTKQSLVKEFKKAAKESQLALIHQEQSYFKQFNSSQKQALKSWREKEKSARHEYFLKHTSGPERREYVQGYIQRKIKFDEDQKNEKTKLRNEWTTKKDTLKKSLNEKEAAFNQALEKGERPTQELWP